MRILDFEGNQIKNYDRTRFRLAVEREVIEEVAATAEVVEEGHYEIIENERGVKSRKYVIDKPGKPACSAYKKFKTTLRLVPFTEEEMKLNDSEKNNLRSREEKRHLKMVDRMNRKSSSTEINELQNEITELRSLLNELLKEKKEEA